MLLISIHDFTYFMPKIRFHANMAFIISMFKITVLQIVHHFLLHSNGGQQFRWMKSFEMLSGKVKLSEIMMTLCWCQKVNLKIINMINLINFLDLNLAS